MKTLLLFFLSVAALLAQNVGSGVGQVITPSGSVNTVSAGPGVDADTVGTAVTVSVDRAVVPFKGVCNGASTPATPTAGYLTGDFCINVTPAVDEKEWCITDNGTACTLWGTSPTGGGGGIPTQITVADTTDTTAFCALFESATGDLGPKTDAGCNYNAATGMLTVTGLTGPLTGNSSTATALQTARTIGGTSFDGTANIVPATATALAANPTDCSVANTFASSIAANGDLTCTGPALRIAKITFSQADIDALDATPKELVAAAGALVQIVPDKIALYYDYNGSVPYTGGGNMSVWYTNEGAGGDIVESAAIAGSFLTGTNDATYFVSLDRLTTTAVATTTNTPLVLQAAGDFICATTCNGMTVIVWYYLADFN